MEVGVEADIIMDVIMDIIMDIIMEIKAIDTIEPMLADTPWVSSAGNVMVWALGEILVSEMMEYPETD